MFKYIISFMLIVFLFCSCDNPSSSKKENVYVTETIEKEKITKTGVFTVDDLVEINNKYYWIFEFESDNDKNLYDFNIIVKVRKNSDYAWKKPMWFNDKYLLMIAVNDEAQFGYEYLIEIEEK